MRAMVFQRKQQVLKPWPKRCGSLLTMELLLVFPIILILLLGMIELTALVIAKQRIQVSAREGARVAALGGSDFEIDSVIQQSLGIHAVDTQVTISAEAPLGTLAPERSGVSMRVIVTDPVRSLLPWSIDPFGLAGERMSAQSVTRRE